MVHHGTIFLLIAFVQTIAAFKLRDAHPNLPSCCKGSHSLQSKIVSNLRRSATISDVEQLEVSDVHRMIDESAVSLMKRFWEIDLQTQRRMDMILRLYEVHIKHLLQI
jgi:hypothetical protein